MSLHAQISPEAQAALAAQRRNSTIAAITIGILLLALLGLLFLAIKLFLPPNTTEPIVTYSEDAVQEQDPVKTKVNNQIKKTPASPSSSAPPVIAAAVTSPFAVPTPEVVVDSINVNFGMSDSFGDGFGAGDGNGFGGGQGFTALPPSMKSRCSPQERMQRLKETGGNERCEEAVVKSLDWIKKTQLESGGWCTVKPVAMTGLSVLCYLGHCETPLSPKYGESVEKGIIYLISNSAKNGGRLSSDMGDRHWPYEHAIATYALAEAYTFCKIINYEIEGLEQAVQQAGDIIIAGQNQNDAWDYGFAPSSRRRDMSLSCWCLQALKACKSTKLKFSNIDTAGKRRGLAAIRACQNASGAVGYSSPNARIYTLTGAGLLCMQQWGEGKSREARKAAEWLSANTPFKWGTGSAEIYGHYYNGQAFMEVGGQAWDDYNARFRDETLGGQAADGSYTIPGGVGVATKSYNSNGGYGKHYRTCLATLMLEVYYRFLPGTSKK